MSVAQVFTCEINFSHFCENQLSKTAWHLSVQKRTCCSFHFCKQLWGSLSSCARDSQHSSRRTVIVSTTNRFVLVFDKIFLISFLIYYSRSEFYSAQHTHLKIWTKKCENPQFDLDCQQIFDFHRWQSGNKCFSHNTIIKVSSSVNIMKGKLIKCSLSVVTTAWLLWQEEQTHRLHFISFEQVDCDNQLVNVA